MTQRYLNGRAKPGPAGRRTRRARVAGSGLRRPPAAGFGRIGVLVWVALALGVTLVLAAGSTLPIAH